MKKDLKLLKGIWDLVDIVETQIKEWRKQLFREVNTEQLQDAVSKLIKQLTKMDQVSRAFNVYKELESTLKNFNNTIPLIINLNDRSMRERHWLELSKRTGVKIVIDDQLKLQDILDQNLHLYFDDVNEIVDCARKESLQEQTLENLRNIWKNQFFQFVAAGDATQTVLNSDQIRSMLQRNELFNVIVPEELAAQLEQDQMQVANMAGNQAVQFFTQDVQDWVKKLSTLDQII